MFEKSEMTLMLFSGAWGGGRRWWKKQKQKTLDTVPLNGVGIYQAVYFWKN
jgi:hypothetical protein